VASESGKHLFTSGKEGSIVKWDLASGKKLATFHKVRPLQSSTAKKGKSKGFADPAVKGHTDEVLALALSGDGKYLASAGKDRRLGVWDAEAGVWLKGFVGQMGHKDLVSVCLSPCLSVSFLMLIHNRHWLSEKALTSSTLARMTER
jgi:ribosomal RNA-processing protein 9